MEIIAHAATYQPRDKCGQTGSCRGPAYVDATKRRKLDLPISSTPQGRRDSGKPDGDSFLPEGECPYDAPAADAVADSASEEDGEPAVADRANEEDALSMTDLGEDDAEERNWGKFATRPPPNGPAWPFAN